MRTIKLLILIMLSAATAASASFAKEFRVGVLYWSSNIPGQVAMSRGLEAEANKINAQATAKNRPTVKLVIRTAGDGANGIENQIRQMQELIRAKVDLLIVQPTDNAALAEPLRLDYLTPIAP